MSKKGFLTLDELSGKIGGGEIETIVVAFTDHYGRLMGKRVDADYFLDSVSKSGTHGCNYLLTTDMAMDPVPATDMPTGSSVTVISIWCPTSLPCASPTGSTKPHW